METKHDTAAAQGPDEAATPSEETPVAEAPAQPPASGQPAEPHPVNISCTRGLTDWLLRNQVSLAFTSYQTGRLYLVGVDANKRVSFHERFLARAMGLWADPQRLVVSTLFQVWRFVRFRHDHNARSVAMTGCCAPLVIDWAMRVLSRFRVV